MATVLALLTFSVISVLHSTVNITITKFGQDAWRVNLIFTLPPLRFTVRIPRHKDNTQSKKHRRGARSIGRTLRFAKAVITHADVTVRELHIPSTDGESFSPHTVTRPWKYHALLLSLSTFIGANAKSLTVYDNAIILISDTEDFRLNINVSVRLTKIVFSLLGLVISKRTRKGAGLTTHVGK